MKDKAYFQIVKYRLIEAGLTDKAANVVAEGICRVLLDSISFGEDLIEKQDIIRG